ncbi:MAG: hypothetical protein LBK99_17200 [Opitutaceae bacterium]|nr:hypothetical protein [Opitutaceae bacterium]
MNNHQKPLRWTLLATLATAVAAMPITALAENREITTGTEVDPGPVSYQSSATAPALTVINDGTSYSGTGISISLNESATGLGLYGVRLYHGSSVALSNSTVAVSATSGAGIRVEPSGSSTTFSFENLLIDITGVNGWGISQHTGIVTGTGLTITGSVNGARGIQTAGMQGALPGYTSVDTFTINLSGNEVIGIVPNLVGASDLFSMSNGTIVVSGTDAYGAFIASSVSTTLTNVNITATGNGSSGIIVSGLYANDHSLVVDGGSIQGNNAITISGQNADEIIFRNGATIAGSILATGTATSTITVESNSSLAGTVTNDSTGAMDLTLSNATWASAGSSNMNNLTLEGATLALELTSLEDQITVANTLTLKNTSTMTVLLGNGILEDILKEGETGDITLDVNSLITGASVQTEEDADLAYILTGTGIRNSAGSTYTISEQGDGVYRVSDINYISAVPEPAVFAVLAGLVMLAWAMRRRRLTVLCAHCR